MRDRYICPCHLGKKVSPTYTGPETPRCGSPPQSCTLCSLWVYSPVAVLISSMAIHQNPTRTRVHYGPFLRLPVAQVGTNGNQDASGKYRQIPGTVGQWAFPGIHCQWPFCRGRACGAGFVPGPGARLEYHLVLQYVNDSHVYKQN